MESVSKGCMVYKPQKTRKNKTQRQDTYSSEPWYLTYKRSWKMIETKIKVLHQTVFSDVLKDVVLYVKHCDVFDNKCEDSIPAVTLLTGVNMPDHTALFSTLTDRLHEEVTPYVATLHSSDCRTVKATIESMTAQFMRKQLSDIGSEGDGIDLKKGHCNFMVLSAWYEALLQHNTSTKNARSSGSLNTDAGSDTQTDLRKNSSHKTPVRTLKRKLNASLSTEDDASGNECDSTVRIESGGIGKTLKRKLERKSRKLPSSEDDTSDTELDNIHLRKKAIAVNSQTSQSGGCTTLRKQSHSYNSSPEKQSLSITPKKVSLNKSPEKEKISGSLKQLGKNCKSVPRELKQTLEQKGGKLLSPAKKKEDCSSLNNNTAKQMLVVVIPEFESFPSHVLEDFILIASGYRHVLPLVLIFGVATAVSALHGNLPRHVSSALNMQVFHAQSSGALLNQVVEKVFLSTDCVFHLGSKAFKLLTDVFLFYNFSVHGFIQGFKVCMAEHFFKRGGAVLCCDLDELDENLESLTSNDLDWLRSLTSFRHFVESQPVQKRAPLLVDDKLFKATVRKLLRKLHKHMFDFHSMLRCLHSLTCSLPKCTLGRHLREVYSLGVSSKIVDKPEYKECMQLLAFQSREELTDKIETVKNILSDIIRGAPQEFKSHVVEMKAELVKFHIQLTNIGKSPSKSPTKSPSKVLEKGISRSQLKEKLLELSQKAKPLSAYEETRRAVLDYLHASFCRFLQPPVTLPLSEVIFFDDVKSVKGRIVGSPRAAIHMALNNPHYYLQCECCKLPEMSAILPTLPDISIVYKLHLECGRLINMYDWLQAFVTVVSPNETGEEQRDVDPSIQARFTRAVAELQFLGFVKPSSRKTDHVMRLTW